METGDYEDRKSAGSGSGHVVVGTVRQRGRPGRGNWGWTGRGMGAVECFWLRSQACPSEAAGCWEGREGAWPGVEEACHHLHSTATVFWVGEADDGLMPVSEEPEEVDAVV